MLYVFVGCLAFGVLYSAVSALLGPHGFGHGGFDHGGFDHGGGVDAHSGTHSADGPSPFNPLVIASAITAFGAVGLIAKAGFGMGDLLSSMVALGFAGAIGAVIFFGIVKLMYNSQSNSIFSLGDLVSSEAEVITPIPRNGMGEIAYVINGVRYNMSAKSSQNEEIPRGTVVIIREMSENAALVQKKITIDDLSRLEEEEEKVRKNEEN